MLTSFTRRSFVGGAIAGVLALTVAGGVSQASSAGVLSPQVQGIPLAAASPEPAKGADHGLKSVLDRFVANGKITQAQEDEILSNVKAEIQDRHGMKGHPGLIGAEGKAVADLFKITPAELRAQLASGKSLHDIAAAHNVTDDTLKATLTSTLKARLDKAVAAGKLTDAQEKTMLAKFQERLPELITATHTADNRGHGNGHHKGKPGTSAQPAQ